ncbi:MAG: hypothetical protein QM742_09335 [Aquabacterium sp.]
MNDIRCAVAPTMLPSLTEQMNSLASGLRAELHLLRLTAYATDAMRVMNRLEVHANLDPDFDQQIRRACPDWRNPGATQDPSDLVTEVLAHLSSGLQRLTQDLEDTLARFAPPSRLASGDGDGEKEGSEFR